MTRDSPVPASVETDIDRLVDRIAAFENDGARPTHVVAMSNGAFGGIYERLRKRLAGAARPDG